MVISQPPENNPSYYYQWLPNAASIALVSLRDTLYFYTCNYNIRVTHRNGAIKHIFYTKIRSTEGSSADCSLFILSLHALVFIMVNITSNLSVWEIWARWPYIHLSVVFPSRMPAGPHFVTQPILLSENIPNIWHKSSTKHKGVRRLKR